MDTTHTATVSDLFAVEKLQLEIATDNGASKAVIDTHKQVVTATQQRIDA